jgi:hypothetical protein
MLQVHTVYEYVEDSNEGDGADQNIFSPPYTISMSLSPSPSKLGRQPGWVACLLVCVSGTAVHVRAGFRNYLQDHMRLSEQLSESQAASCC